MTTPENDLAGAGSEITAPEPVETPEVTNPEATGEQKQDDAAKPNEASDADKSLKRLQRRVDRVTAARYQAEARAQQLEAQLARYQQQTQQEEGEKPSIDPARIDEIVSQKAREIARVEQVAERSNKAFESGVKAFGDAFKASIAAVIDEAGPLIDPKGLPTSLGEAILDSDEPAKLLHYLGQNPEAAESLQGLTAAQLGRRIARIEAEMGKAPEPAPSKAPKPLQPVKTQVAGNGEPDMKDTAAWIRWKNQQDKKRG